MNHLVGHIETEVICLKISVVLLSVVLPIVMLFPDVDKQFLKTNQKIFPLFSGESTADFRAAGRTAGRTSGSLAGRLRGPCGDLAATLRGPCGDLAGRLRSDRIGESALFGSSVSDF